MKQTIEIEVPDGKKAVWKDGKVVFEDIEPRLPKTWEEFCKNYRIGKAEYHINSACHLRGTRSGAERQEVLDRNILLSKQAAEQHLAFMQLHQLRDCYRNGWKPCWDDGSDKSCIERYYDKNTDSIEFVINWHFTDTRFLSFPTYELANEFLTNFRELIEQAGDLI